MHAILLVGGKGTRLAPYTRHRPKGLMKLGRHTILSIILSRLRACGFSRVTLCVSHLGNMIRSEFGNGHRLGITIDYSSDDRPLGTVAPLTLVPEWTAPAVVMNGDLLTTVDFADLYEHHVRREGVLTVTYQRRQLATGVGLLRVTDDRVTAVWEKPSFEWNVNSGIYVADPLVRKYIPPDTPTDMPSLITTLIQSDELVCGYSFGGSWHDIGTPARYLQARAEFLSDPARYLSPRASGSASGNQPIDVELADDAAPGGPPLDISALGQPLDQPAVPA